MTDEERRHLAEFARRDALDSPEVRPSDPPPRWVLILGVVGAACMIGHGLYRLAVAVLAR